MRLLKLICMPVLGLAMCCGVSPMLRADDVTDWNQHMLRAGTVGGASPLVMSRVAAIVQASVFDAVNGIDRKYAPVHVTPAGPAGASRRAAAVEAAYTALVALFPAQKGTFDARLAVSLTDIASDPHETSAGIASGTTWGQTAANGILSWRATDGFTPAPPPFLGGSAVGEWRPTPPGFAPGAGPQFAYMTPWVINAPSQFRPGGPPALTICIADFGNRIVTSPDWPAAMPDTSMIPFGESLLALPSIEASRATRNGPMACRLWLRNLIR